MTKPSSVFQLDLIMRLFSREKQHVLLLRAPRGLNNKSSNDATLSDNEIRVEMSTSHADA